MPFSISDAERLFCIFKRRKSFFSLAFPILFVNFVVSFSWMAGKGMLADKSGDWHYFMRKTFTRFLLACWNLGNFKNRLEGGRCERLCIFVYMQHEVRAAPQKVDTEW